MGALLYTSICCAVRGLRLNLARTTEGFWPADSSRHLLKDLLSPKTSRQADADAEKLVAEVGTAALMLYKESEK